MPRGQPIVLEDMPDRPNRVLPLLEITALLIKVEDGNGLFITMPHAEVIEVYLKDHKMRRSVKKFAVYNLVVNRNFCADESPQQLRLYGKLGAPPEFVSWQGKKFQSNLARLAGWDVVYPPHLAD